MFDCGSSSTCSVREFTELRRLLQRKRHIKIELCVRLIVLRLFEVSHVVQNRRSAFHLLGTNGFPVETKTERFTAEGSRCRQNLKNMKISRPCLADYVQKLHFFIFIMVT